MNEKYVPAEVEAAAHAGDARTRLTEIKGMVPSLAKLPPGCAFAPRCAQRFEKCTAEPQLGSGERAAACFRVTA